MAGWSLVLVALAGIVFTTEMRVSASNLKNYSVEFPRTSTSAPGDQGNAPDGQTTAATVTLGQNNITAVGFAFTITDNYPLKFFSPAGAIFKVISPEGVELSAECPPGGATTATVFFRPVAPVPENTTISAASLPEAEKNAAARYPPAQNGTGDWTIEITVERNNRLPVRSSISWTATVRVESYSLKVTELLKP